MILAFGAAEGLTMHLRNNSYGTAQGGASNTSVIQNTLPAGKGQTGGRLNLLNSTVATGSYLGTRNRVDGNATSIRKLADAGLNRFMEIHIYFDLSGEADCVSCGGSGCQYCRETGKANLMHYYVDNNETPVSSVILPSKAEYFTTYGGGIAFEIQVGTNFKLRNFTISKGNVLQYID